jgi:hypothetical protein
MSCSINENDSVRKQDDPRLPLKAAAGFTALLAGEPTALETLAEQQRAAQLQKDEQRAEDEAPLIARAEEAVLQSLRDPDSAQFGRIAVRYCNGLDCNDDPTHGRPMVCGGVNAKNGFGGYTGFQTFIYGNETLIPPEAVTEVLPLAAKICLD